MTAQPIHMIATVSVPPSQRNKLGSEITKLVDPSRAEYGCLRYDVFRIQPGQLDGVPDTGGDFAVIESWRNLDALKQHLASAHFQAFASKFAPGEVFISLQFLEPVLPASHAQSKAL